MIPLAHAVVVQQQAIDHAATSYRKRLPWLIGAVRKGIDASGQPCTVTRVVELLPNKEA